MQENSLILNNVSKNVSYTNTKFLPKIVYFKVYKIYALIYFSEPRNVTGTSESYLFWNKIGRQRVLQLIESKLEY